MSVTQALNAATSGLSASSRRASVVSSNIANALTEGYSRREVSTAERVVAGQGAGVEVVSVNRAENAALTASRRLAAADSNRDGVLQNAQTQLSALLGGPEDPFAFFATVQNLEDSFTALRETPESTVRQQNTVNAARQVASQLQQLSASNASLRENADAEIAAQVDKVNAALLQIEELNTEISVAANSGVSTAALEDQRQRLIDTVSDAVPVKVIPRSNNSVDLMTSEGVFLLAGSARQLSFDRTPVIAPDMTFGAGQLSGLSVDGVDITPTGTSSFSRST